MIENKMREALERISRWEEHTLELAVNYGSNGVIDHYRQIASEALAKCEARNLKASESCEDTLAASLKPDQFEAHDITEQEVINMAEVAGFEKCYWGDRERIVVFQEGPIESILISFGRLVIAADRAKRGVK